MAFMFTKNQKKKKKKDNRHMDEVQINAHNTQHRVIIIKPVLVCQMGSVNMVLP